MPDDQNDKNGQAGDPKKPDGQDQDPKKDQKSDNQDGKDKADEMVTIPKAKWNQMYARVKKTEEEDQKRADELKKAEEEKLKKEKDHETLISKLETERDALLKDKNELVSTNKVLDEILKNKIKQIPEEKRTLVPQGLSPKDRLAYITANEKLLMGATNAGTSGTPKNKPGTVGEIEEKMARFEELKKKKLETGFLQAKETQELMKLTREIQELKDSK